MAIVLVVFVCASCLAQAPAKAVPKPSIESLIQQSKFTEADAELRAVLDKNPGDARALNLLGVLRRKQGRYTLAERSFVASIAADDKLVAAYENLGALMVEEERLPEATYVYERIIELLPQSGSQQNMKALAELATLYQQQGDFQKSLDLVAKIPATSRSDKLLPVMAADYLALKRDKELDETIREIVQKAATNPEVAPRMAMIFVRRGMAGDAGELLGIVGPHQKKTARFLSAQAEVLSAAGKRQEARAAVTEALRIDPKSADALLVAARLAGDAGDWKAAVEYLTKIWKSEPPTADLLQSLVYAAMQVDDLQTAHSAAMDLNDLQPNVPENWLTLAVVLVRASHWGEADTLLAKYLEQKPSEKRALLAKGACEYNLGKPEEAKKHLTASLGQGARDGEAHYVLGLLAKQQGDWTLAASEMEQALALDPSNARALPALGQFYLQLGEAAKARTVLEEAVQKLPEDAQAHYQLAQAYRKLGESEKAKEEMIVFQKLSARKIPQPVGEAPK